MKRLTADSKKLWIGCGAATVVMVWCDGDANKREQKMNTLEKHLLSLHTQTHTETELSFSPIFADGTAEDFSEVSVIQ